MKIFYTERDIEDMHAAGQTQLEINDDIVLTELAREKAVGLGLRLVLVKQGSSQAEQLLRAFGAHLPASSKNPGKATTGPASSIDLELVERVKAGVIARLGTIEFNGLLDQVIPQIIAQVVNNPPPNKQASPAPRSSDY
ncbi:MAG TPA: hypothetical protein VGD99_26980 [Anaerolineae bacterium]|jgi:hypothetical protein